MVINEKRLKNSLPNLDIVFCDTIDSTNEECKRRVVEKTPLLVVAREQTSGKGRMGRSFLSQKDSGLYMSLMLKAKSDISDTVCITSCASVCVCDAIISLSNTKPKIKWVNDILVNGKKVCGILCELCCDDNFSPTSVIVGIGVNTNAIFPKELENIAGNIENIDTTDICIEIVKNLLYEYEHIEDRKFIEKYRLYSCVIGKEISYTKNGITKTATTIGIDDNGALILDNNEKLNTGEISVKINDGSE